MHSNGHARTPIPRVHALHTYTFLLLKSHVILAHHRFSLLLHGCTLGPCAVVHPRHFLSEDSLGSFRFCSFPRVDALVQHVGISSGLVVQLLSIHS